MNFQKPFFVKLPDDFSVKVFNYEKEKILIEPSGIHMTYDRMKVYIQYAGADADNYYAMIEVPSEPEFLRKFSCQINGMAKNIES